MGEVFNEVFETKAQRDLSPVPLGVFGTPDLIAINVATSQIIIGDFKSAKATAFSYRFKGDRSYQNEAQLGTYIPGIMDKLRQCGINLKIEESSLLYIRKDEHKMVTHSYDPKNAISAAQNYWRDTAIAFLDTLESGGSQLPGAKPPMKWMCDYCSVFDNKTECNPIVDIESFIGEAVQGELL